VPTLLKTAPSGSHQERRKKKHKVLYYLLVDPRKGEGGERVGPGATGKGGGESVSESETSVKESNP